MKQTYFLLCMYIAMYTLNLQAQNINENDRLLNLNIKKGKKTLLLNWELQPPNADAIYTIFRAAEDDTTFEKVATGLTSPCFLDSTVATNTSYRYGIKWEVSDKGNGRSNMILTKLPSRNIFSILFPGKYQFQTHQSLKGGVLTTASVLSLLTAGGFHAAYYYSVKDTENKMNDYFNLFKKSTNSNSKEKFITWQNAYDKEQMLKSGAIISSFSVGAVYLWHIVDFIIFPLKQKCTESNLNVSLNYHTDPYVSSQLSVMINF